MTISLNEHDRYRDTAILYSPGNGERQFCLSLELRPRMFLYVQNGCIIFKPPFKGDQEVIISRLKFPSLRAAWKAAMQVRDHYIKQKVAEGRIVIVDREFYKLRLSAFVNGSKYIVSRRGKNYYKFPNDKARITEIMLAFHTAGNASNLKKKEISISTSGKKSRKKA